MTSLIKSVSIAAIANAVSLAAAAWIFPHFEVRPYGFIIAVLLFTLFSVALKEVIGGTVDRFVLGYSVAGGLALTAVALMITDLLVPEHGFAIEGWGTRAGVTAVVWAAGIAYGEVDKKAPEPRKA